MAQGADSIKAKKGGLFEGLSMAQVVAGALAAVTSMLLASQIGIAGSVIGVGVGSVVSAVASQMYKKFLTKSAEKIRDVLPGDGNSSASDDNVANEIAVTRRIEADAVPCVDVAEVAIAGKTMPFDAVAIRRSRTPRVDDDALCDDVTVRRARLLRERKRRVQRRVIAVSAVSAVVAVLMSALVVNFVTTGQGLGVKAQPLMASSVWGGLADANNAPAPSAPSDAAGSGSSGGTSSGSSSSAGATDGSSGTQDGTQGSTGSEKPSEGTQGGTTSGGDQSGSSSGSTTPEAGGSTGGSGSTGSADTGGSTGSGSGSSGSTGSGSGSSSSSGGSSGSGTTGGASGTGATASSSTRVATS
ncbi:MAG: hypothetical protein VB027_06285 [Gordonibacter sp.]|nr:hypothetical protein [Gordonibacter sp.]